MFTRAMKVVLLVGTMLLITAGCTRCTDSVQEKNKALVRRFAEAVNARQFDVMDELVAPNFARHFNVLSGLVPTCRGTQVSMLLVS